jgi:hypothetical protein
MTPTQMRIYAVSIVADITRSTYKEQASRLASPRPDHLPPAPLDRRRPLIRLVFLGPRHFGDAAIGRKDVRQLQPLRVDREDLDISHS